MYLSFLNEIQLTKFRNLSSSFPIAVFFIVSLVASSANAQRRSAPGNSQFAVVVDERLAVLRDSPSLTARLLKRLSRGRSVSLINIRRSPEGVMFYRVAVTRRTRGWLLREAVVSPVRQRDDERLFNLIRASNDFDRIARASIFLDVFRNSSLRPGVLLILGSAAEDAAQKLSAEAVRRLDEVEMKAGGAPELAYFMNYNGLDRYRRLGVVFIFDESRKQFHYGGASWREIVRRYPRSPEAKEARHRLSFLKSLSTDEKRTRANNAKLN